MKSKKTLIIVIIIIAVLAVASTVFGYLFIATDTFKSDKELFVKYMTQNTEMFTKITDLQSSEVYENLKNEEKYESNTKVNLTHSEGGEISNPLNNLAVQLDIQKDNENKYFYANGQILFSDEEYLQLELIKEQELYGVRFSDVAKQFITVKDDENFENVANDIGVDTEQLQNLMEVLDGTIQLNEEIISQEEINTLKEKYLKIVTDSISNGTFSSLKKAMITYNNTTIKSNAYTVSLSSEQVQNMIIEILNSLKTETVILEKMKDFINSETLEEQIDGIIKTITEEVEVPTIKITVYEKDAQTIRTLIEIGSYKVIVENSEENNVVSTKIQFSNLEAKETTGYNIEISKEIANNQEIFSITMETVEGEESYTISFLNELQLEDSKIALNSSINYKKDILTIGGKLENTINIGNDFEKQQALEATNNVVLNDCQSERRIAIINVLKENVPQKVETRVALIAEALGMRKTESEDTTYEGGMPQVEINKFNAKFEFYTGDTVSSENVKTLLEIVKNNLTTCEIIPVENQEETENSNLEDVKYNIKLNIEKDKTNEEAINQVIEKIEDKKKYRVSISYKQENGLIDYITIEESQN